MSLSSDRRKGVSTSVPPRKLWLRKSSSSAMLPGAVVQQQFLALLLATEGVQVAQAAFPGGASHALQRHSLQVHLFSPICFHWMCCQLHPLGHGHGTSV